MMIMMAFALKTLLIGCLSSVVIRMFKFAYDIISFRKIKKFSNLRNGICPVLRSGICPALKHVNHVTSKLVA